MYYGSSEFGDTLDFYKVSNNLYAKFGIDTGTAMCYSRDILPYPKEEPCVQSAVKLHYKGNVTLDEATIGYDNCHKIIGEFGKNVSDDGVVYSKNIVLKNSNIFRVCFTISLIYRTYERKCPEEYRRYQIDTRNFYFLRANRGSTKNKRFYSVVFILTCSHVSTHYLTIPIPFYHHFTVTPSLFSPIRIRIVQFTCQSMRINIRMIPPLFFYPYRIRKDITFLPASLKLACPTTVAAQQHSPQKEIPFFKEIFYLFCPPARSPIAWRR